MNRPCVTAGASFLDAFKGLCYVPDMQKVRQPAGTALMILAFPAAIYGAFPWGIALGAFLFLLGVVVAASRFSAIVWSWCLFSLGMYLAAPFIWMWNPDYFFSRSFDILLISGCLVGSLVLLAIRFAVIPVLWPRIFRHFVEGSPTLEDLAPEKGKTVAELRGGIELPVRACGPGTGRKMGENSPGNSGSFQKPQTAGNMGCGYFPGLARSRVFPFRGDGRRAGPGY